MTARQQQIREIKAGINPVKSALIGVLRQLEPLSKKESARLARIIGRLEAWQNS